MRGVSLALVAALLVGCGSDSSNSPKSSPGTYTLNSVGGLTLPAVVYSETNYTLEVTAGSVTLNSNGTFDDSYSIRENDAGNVTIGTIPCSGNWTQSGNSITLQETVTTECGDYGTASWDGSNTLTIDWQGLGVPAVHRR